MRKNKKNTAGSRLLLILRYAPAVTAACLAAGPVVFVITGSLMGRGELGEHLAPVLFGTEGFVTWRLFPMYPTLQNIVELLCDSPEFFHMFWNTMKLTAGILLGQLLCGMPAAWGLARYSFRGCRLVYGLYILLMLMPFQVLMLPEYQVLEKLSINNTLWAVILPGAFSTFPVFLMYRFFAEVPEEVLEAARIDGAGEGRVFLYIGLPLGRTGIVSALLLQFLECFGMIEQPLAFLKDKRLFPLALYLPEIGAERAGFAFAASLVALAVPLLLFFAGSEYLEQGIAASGVSQTPVKGIGKGAEDESFLL